MIMDHVGDVEVAAVHQEKARWDTDKPEAMVVRFGMKVVLAYSFDNLVIESDSIRVINDI